MMLKDAVDLRSMIIPRPNSPAGTRTAPIVVVKVGTSSLLKGGIGGHLHLSNFGLLAETCAELQRSGMRVVVVTSGAVGVGCQVLNTKKPSDLAGKQALAAVGMVRLMRMYDDFFQAVGQPIAQVLISLDNIMDRTQYMNAQSTFRALLDKNIIPIVNENDTVAVPDTKFGDNDTLSAHVAALVDADYLFLLTDVDGLYTANPNTNPDAVRIHVVESIDDLEVSTADAGAAESGLGTGGMATKLSAARLATASGCNTIIMHANSLPDMPEIISANKSVGTLFLAMPRPLRGRKRWILLLPPAGDLVVNAITAKALENNKSLFSTGIIACRGEFEPEDGVRLITVDAETGEERNLGRAIVNYSSEEIIGFIGKTSEEFYEIVGYAGAESISHRNNICCWIPFGQEPSSCNLVALGGGNSD
jgi:glutamate 5-kinase/origin recognition complex subunit 2